MPIRGYGVWKGTDIRFDTDDARTDPSKPHGHIKFTDDSGDEIDSAVNVKSSSNLTEVVYWAFREPNFIPSTLPIIGRLEALTEARFYGKNRNPDLHIDFLRDGLFALQDGHIPPWNTPRIPNDDIVDFLEDFVENGRRQNATIYIFGQRYPPGRKGIHQVHMMQGNFYDSDHPSWYDENGIHQDGGIFLQFPNGEWEAFFMAFAAQASRTDDRTGIPTGSTILDDIAQHSGGGGHTTPPTAPGGTRPPRPALTIRIHSALVNPVGPDNDPVPEMIRIENNGSVDASLAGWYFENQSSATQTLPGGAAIAAEGQAEFPAGTCYLTNSRDGTIILKNAEHQVVDIVEYKASAAAEPGKWIVFHEGDARRGFNVHV